MDAQRTPRGLSSREAQARIVTAGPNDPAPTKSARRWSSSSCSFANPLVTHPPGRERGLGVPRRRRERGDHRHDGRPQHRDQLRPDVPLAARAAIGCARRSRPRRRCSATASGASSRAREIVPGDVVRSVRGRPGPRRRAALEARDLHVQRPRSPASRCPVEKARRREASPTSADGAPRHVGRERQRRRRSCTRPGARPRSATSRRAWRRAPPETEFERGIAALRRAHHARRSSSSCCSSCVVEHRAAPQRARVAALRGGARGRPHARVLADDHDGHAGAGRGRAWPRKGHREAPARSRTSAASTCSAATRPGRSRTGKMTLDASLDALGASSRAAARAARTINSRFETGIKSPLDVAILAARAAGRGARLRRSSTRSPSTSSGAALSSRRRRRRRDWLLITKGAPETSSRRHALRSGGASAARRGARARCERDLRVAEPRGASASSRSRHAEVRGAAAYGAARRARARRSPGFLAFFDPPLEDARTASRALARDGVDGEDPHRRQRAGRPPRLRRRSGSTRRRSCSATRSSA